MKRYAIALFTLPFAAAAGAAAPAAPTACSLLTRERVLEFAPNPNRQVLEVLLRAPPEQSRVGAKGTGCEYGGIHLQVDPFPAPARVEQDLEKQGARVTGLGDVAWFRDNGGHFAELYVRAGAHVLTLQMGIPSGSTATAVQPNLVGLAKDLLPQLP